MAGKMGRLLARKDIWFVLAAAALLAAGTVRRRALSQPPVVTGDSREYLAMGRSLRATKILAFEPVAAYAGRAPMYPVLLAAAADSADGVNPERAQRVQAALALLLAAAAGALALCLHSPAAGALAAAAAGFHPDLAKASGWVGIELLFGLCLTAVAWALARDAARRDERSAAAVALAIGASLWCRSTLIFLPPLLCALALREPKRGRRPWILLFLPYLILAPWTFRNAVRLGAFVPVERQAGVYNLFVASQGKLAGMGDEKSQAIAEKVVPGWSDMDSVQREAALYRTAERAVLASPVRYALGTVRRAWLLWGPHWLLLLAAAWALYRLRGPEFGALGGLWLYLNVHALMGIDARYAWPALPFLCALAACGAADLFAAAISPAERVRRLSRLPAAWLAGPLALAALSAAALASESAAERAARVPTAPASCPEAESRLGPWRLLGDAKRAQDRGVILYLRGDARGSADCFRAALALEPRYAAARLGAGTALAALGDGPGALAQYDAAVGVLEDLDERGDLMLAAYQSRASALRALRREDEARRDDDAAKRLLSE